MDFCCNADTFFTHGCAGRTSNAGSIHLSSEKIVPRFPYALIAALTLASMPWSMALAEGNALNGAYEWKYTCQHCHGTPQPDSSAAFSDYDTTANKLSVYASDPAAITKAANEGYIVPEGNSNDKVDPGANTNDPMGTWSGMGPKRLGVGRTPTQFAMDLSAYFATFFSLPDAPSIAAATPGNTQATVSFSAPKSDLTITAYTVTAQPGGITASGSASPVIVSGLSNGTAYRFTVTATSNAGTGKASAPSNAVTPNAATGSPVVAGGLTSGYSAALKPPLAAPTLPSAPAPAVPAIAGPIAIHPGNVATNNSPSAIHSLDQPSGLGAPVIKFVRAGNAQVKVYFDSPAIANITGYTVTALSNGKPTGITAKGLSSPITVSGLTNGNDYTFTLTVNTSTGRSATSFRSNTVTPLRILGD